MRGSEIRILAEDPARHACGIEALYDEAFGPGHFAKTAERLREYNHSLPELNRVALLEDRVIAATRVWPVSIERGGAALFVGPVAVTEDLRGSRLGLRVTQAAMDAARRAGWHGAVLIGAPAYFSEIGFVQVPPDKLIFPGPQDQARVMVKDLSEAGIDYSGKIKA